MLESTPYAKEVADLPLGMIAGTPYSQTAVQLGVGDLVVLYIRMASLSPPIPAEKNSTEKVCWRWLGTCQSSRPSRPERRCSLV
jgi:hypothetical protein